MYLLFNLHIWSSSIPKCHLIDENLRAQSFQFGTSQTIILKKNRIFFPEKDYTINMPANNAMFSILIINIIFLTIECHHSGYNRLHAHFVWVSSLGCSGPVAPLVFATYIMYQCPTLCKLWYYDVQKGSCGDSHTVDIMVNIV